MKKFIAIPKWLNDFVVSSEDSGIMPEQIGLGILMLFGVTIWGDYLFVVSVLNLLQK